MKNVPLPVPTKKEKQIDRAFDMDFCFSETAASKAGADVVRIGCSILRGGGGELDTLKNLDLWLQLVCTKLKLKQAI